MPMLDYLQRPIRVGDTVRTVSDFTGTFYTATVVQLLDDAVKIQVGPNRSQLAKNHQKVLVTTNQLVVNHQDYPENYL